MTDAIFSGSPIRQAITTVWQVSLTQDGSCSGHIRAKCHARTIRVSYDQGKSEIDNHYAAAKLLADKMGWDYGTWHGGALPGAGFVFVMVEEA